VARSAASIVFQALDIDLFDHIASMRFASLHVTQRFAKVRSLDATSMSKTPLPQARSASCGNVGAPTFLSSATSMALGWDGGGAD